MTRSVLGTANKGEAVKPSLRVAELAELVFPGGTICCTTGEREVSWNGKTFLANARLVGPGTISETSDLKARPIAIRLSGLDSTLISRVLSDNYHNAEVNLWLAFFDEDWALVAAPHEVAPNLLMSGITIALEAGSGDMELSAEYFDIYAERDSAVLATPSSQRLRYSTDTGMDKVARILTQEIVWGGQYGRAGGREPFLDDRTTK